MIDTEFGPCDFFRTQMQSAEYAVSIGAQAATNLGGWQSVDSTDSHNEGSKDEMNIVLQGPEQYFWKGTEAGWMGCYDFPGETWAGDW